MEDIEDIQNEIITEELILDQPGYVIEKEKLEETCGNIMDGIEFIEVGTYPITSNLLCNQPFHRFFSFFYI